MSSSNVCILNILSYTVVLVLIRWWRVRLFFISSRVKSITKYPSINLPSTNLTVLYLGGYTLATSEISSSRISWTTTISKSAVRHRSGSVVGECRSRFAREMAVNVGSERNQKRAYIYSCVYIPLNVHHTCVVGKEIHVGLVCTHWVLRDVSTRTSMPNNIRMSDPLLHVHTANSLDCCEQEERYSPQEHLIQEERFAPRRASRDSAGEAGMCEYLVDPCWISISSSDSWFLFESESIISSSRKQKTIHIYIINNK